MQSNLREIYKTLSDMQVFVGDTYIPCRGLDNLDPRINRGNLPIRLLLPVGSNASGRSISILDASGRGRKAQWTIPDLYLAALVTQGKGLEEYAGQLVDYVVAYEEAVLTRRTQMPDSFIITDLALDTGIFEWPVESDVWYFGARAVVTARELI